MATQLGWRVLRYTPQMISNDPVGVIEQVLAVAGMRLG
jgi:very-short-patch-repair endonuclease